MGNSNEMFCHDNRVSLKLSKKINDSKVLEEIIEILSKTDEIIFYNYNLLDNILVLDYRCNKSKLKIMKQKSFIFNDYEFSVAEELNQKHELYDVSKDTVILKNIDKTVGTEVIKAYINYLTQNNQIIGFEVSKIYSDTMFFKFQKHVDFNGLLKQHRSAPQVYGRNVSIYQKMETFMVLAKLNVSVNSETDINEYLTKTFQFNNEYFWQSFDDFSKVPYVIIKFVCIDMKCRFLTQMTRNLDRRYINCVEDVSNIFLLNDFIASIDSQNSKKDEIHTKNEKYPHLNNLDSIEKCKISEKLTVKPFERFKAIKNECASNRNLKFDSLFN